MKTHNTLKTTIAALLLIVSSQTFSSDSITDWEQYFYEEKQKSYQQIVSKFPEKSASETDTQSNEIYALPINHAEIRIKLKEQLTDPNLRGASGFTIEEKSSEKYKEVLKKLTDVMFDLPANSFIDFTFRKATMSIEVSVTRQGIDYLNSRDDIDFHLPIENRIIKEDGIPKIEYLK